LGPARDFASTWIEDPGRVEPRRWIPRLQDLYRAGQRVGGSRVIYRGAYLSVDDTTEIFVGAGRDLLQRLVRTRSGLVLIAQRTLRSGTAPVVEMAERNGLMGLEATSVPLRALEAAAERVNVMTSLIDHPRGEMDVILDPSCAALMAHSCVGPALQARHWVTGESRAADFAGQSLAAPGVTLIDDPSVPGAYGSYFFDHQGQLASPSKLIDAGVLMRPIADQRSANRLAVEGSANGRRGFVGAPVCEHPSNIAFAPGQATRDQLVSTVERGLLLEGAVFAHADPHTWRFVLRAARAYEIDKGKTTGVLYGDIDIRGHVPALLTAVRGLSSTSIRIPARSSVAATMGGPYILTRAEVT
jgi:predicted Zn-dependent protease